MQGAAHDQPPASEEAAGASGRGETHSAATELDVAPFEPATPAKQQLRPSVLQQQSPSPEEAPQSAAHGAGPTQPPVADRAPDQRPAGPGGGWAGGICQPPLADAAAAVRKVPGHREQGLPAQDETTPPAVVAPSPHVLG